MVTEGHTADAKHTQNAQTLSRDSPVPFLRYLADRWANDVPFPRLLGGRERGGRGKKLPGETLVAGKPQLSKRHQEGNFLTALSPGVDIHGITPTWRRLLDKEGQ